MSSDSDDDIPLGSRAAGGSKSDVWPVAAPPQRAAAGGKTYAESSDDEAPTMSRPRPKGKSDTAAPVPKTKSKVKTEQEPQSAAQAAPGSAAREAAVKQAAAEMLRDESRDAARQAAKKQAAVKNSGKKPQIPQAAGNASRFNGKTNARKDSSKMPQIPNTAPAKQTGMKKGSNGAKEVKERKKFDLDHQRKDTPEASDPLRIFYSSTQKQIAALKDSNGKARRSDMSNKWLLEHGLIPENEIAEVARSLNLDSKSRNTVRSPLSGTKRKAPDTTGRTTKQAAARKDTPKSKVPPSRKPAPAPTVPSAVKNPMISATKRAAADKRVKAEAQLAAMAGDSDED